MTFFTIFALIMIGAVLGYMIGHNTGLEEGYILGSSEQYKAKR
jgi:hypothetical protein